MEHNQQISDFKHCSKLSATMIKWFQWTHGTGHNKKIVKNFYSIKHYWIMFLPSPFPKRWLQNVCFLTWAMTKKPGLCKLSSERTFIDFSLQCKIRAWGLIHEKGKDVLRQIQLIIQELFCLREFSVSCDPRSAPQTAKQTFFFKSHKVTFVTWKRQPTFSWY